VESFSEAEAEQLFHAFLDAAFGEGEVTRQREALFGFARKVEMLPIAVAVGANLLREKSASPLGRSLLKLRLHDLNDGVRDVPQLFQKAIAAQPPRERKLLAAAAVCVQEGFWLPLGADIAGLNEDGAYDAADRLVGSSLLRVVDRDRQRFQLHALLREQVSKGCGEEELWSLRQAHAAALERLFGDWETRWRDCRECLAEIIHAAGSLWERRERVRQSRLSFDGYSVAVRIGELEEAFRILKQEETICLELGDKDGLQASYGNQANILKAWGRLEEAMALSKKEEAICLELGNKDGLQASYGNQALILKARGRLDEAMALHKKEEAICLELGDKDGLQVSYGNQALILKARGRLEEAMALHRKKEAICLELGNKDSLQRSYGNQANILKEWGQLEEAMALQMKKETICLELGNKDSLQISYGNQALILKEWGRLEEAMALLKKEEAICLELGNKDGLQRSYGNQALILKEWGQLEEAMALLKRQEAICLELGAKRGLGHCYWQWGALAKGQGDRQAGREKLEQAFAIFAELGMPREREAVQADLDKIDAG
jgi:tetratricopeptide (TPR) repeat protein